MAITDKFNLISNGSQPLPAQLAAQKNAGATTASLTLATGWDTSTAKHIRMYQTQIVNGAVSINPTTLSFYKATLSGTTLSNLTLIWSATGSDQQYPAGATVDLAPNAGWADDLINGIKLFANQDGSLIPTAVRTALGLGNTSNDGWGVVSQNVTSVTANGNRSYDITFDASVASVLSPGMRLQVTKTVTGNSYMGGLMNGSSHYFTKTTPSGTLGTVTNNFTIEAVVQPTAYQDAGIIARGDSTPNNGFSLSMSPSGQIVCYVRNGGAANTRSATTYQSLPLNKKTHVTASWTSGTVVIYFDGVSVPFAVTTSGTAPTTAGTGGDFSIGRPGAYAGSYFPGYISNVAVFDAVLSAATIKQHATYKLTGSETNCIGAWSLDNTANDQSSAGNNLTATGGVGFTAMSPHGQLGNSVDGTKAVALVMAVGTTTITAQCPEGCTIPTTGGVSAVSYSTQANPYNWVSDKGRWEIQTIIRTQLYKTSAISDNTFYNLSGSQFYIGAGAWSIGYDVFATTTHAGVIYLSGKFALSTSATSGSEIADTVRTTAQNGTSSTNTGNQITATKDGYNTSGGTIYGNISPVSSTTAGLYMQGNICPCILFAKPSGL